jgi:hypothetical protein
LTLFGSDTGIRGNQRDTEEGLSDLTEDLMDETVKLMVDVLKSKRQLDCSCYNSSIDEKGDYDDFWNFLGF